MITFERPATRAAELGGKSGEVRFLDLPQRTFVMIDGEGAPGEAAFAPRMPGLYATAWPLRFALKKRASRRASARSRGCGGRWTGRRISMRSSVTSAATGDGR